jgi:hypothetical protein
VTEGRSFVARFPRHINLLGRNSTNIAPPLARTP